VVFRNYSEAPALTYDMTPETSFLATLNSAYTELVTEIINKIYASNPTELNALIWGDLFGRLLSGYLGFEIANFYFYDRDEGRLRFFHEAVDDGIEMPFYEVRSEQGDEFVYSKVPDDVREERRTRQIKSLRRYEDPLTAMLCYNILTTDRHQRSESEEKHNWILVPEGEVIVFSFEYTLRKMLAERGISNKSDAIREIETTSIGADCWRRMHDPERHPQMVDREAHSWEEAKEWLAMVLQDRIEYSYLWIASPLEASNWFIHAHVEVAQCLDLRNVDVDYDAIRNLARLAIQHSYPLAMEGSIGMADSHFFDRSRISPSLELLHGSHNIVMFLIQFDFSAEVVQFDEPLTAFLLGTFYDRQKCEEHGEKIRNIYSLVATRDLLRYAMKKLESSVKTVRKTEAILATFSGSTFIHELKNPLALIGANAGLVSKEYQENKDSPLILEYLDAIRAIAQDALTMIEGVRSIAGLAVSSKRVPLNLSVVVPKLIESLKDSKGIPADNLTLNLECSEPITVYFNEISLKIVLKNLINNAVEAIGDKKVPVIAIKCWREQGLAKLSAEDNGPGIDSSVLGTLFKPFVSSKDKASGKNVGLGLYLCENIIELQGGKIAVENLAAGGAKFTISFRSD
jgi:signal transduction histidine kinase